MGKFSLGCRRDSLRSGLTPSGDYGFSNSIMMSGHNNDLMKREMILASQSPACLGTLQNRSHFLQSALNFCEQRCCYAM